MKNIKVALSLSMLIIAVYGCESGSQNSKNGDYSQTNESSMKTSELLDSEIENWERFTSNDGGFSLLIPSEPEILPDNGILLQTDAATFATIWDIVDIQEYSFGELVQEFKKSFIKDGLVLLEDRSLSNDSHLLIFDVPDNYSYAMKLVLSDNILYRSSIRTFDKDINHPNVTNFLNSFKILN